MLSPWSDVVDKVMDEANYLLVGDVIRIYLYQSVLPVPVDMIP